MRSLVYLSEANAVFDTAALQKLVTVSVEHNLRARITGYLYFEEQRFLQYLEGEAEDVDQLMRRLALDPRHSVIRMVQQDTRRTRRFPDWHMRWLRQHEMGAISLEYGLTTILKASKAGEACEETVDEIKIWTLVDQVAAVRHTSPFV